ncbi:arginase (macronuclear) [Tetrahymena thermophila SB210]|uniref:Arginase n=1 Tax=Tetrahymena thermophila (strain SB210) TaxID=312017 RepID=I7LW93_TETTS|nr:arginase [Tetrahymena thermophila SB210]EAS01195.2 arginase [Tetrahymena thermophila SB210]|eukprot:XP_001021440.2 arginase [Tetrahymena thermophila SB210]
MDNCYQEDLKKYQNNQNIIDEFVLHDEKYFGQYIQYVEDLQSLVSSFRPDMKENRIFITGFPFDEGTYRNGGRIGAEQAPKSFRDLLQKEKIYTDVLFEQRLKIYDLGDIPKQKYPDEDDEEHEHIRARQLTLEEAHLSQRQKLGQILDYNLQFENRVVIFAIGGSNDQSYCNVQSIFDCFPDKKIGVINIDSQFGVSQLKGNVVHNGSPFRLMLENPVFKKNESKFIQFGAKGSNCCQEDYEYLKQKGAQIYWLEKDIRRYLLNKNKNQEDSLTTQAGQLFEDILNKLQQECDKIFISLDVESINAKFCPGVSSPSVTGGLSDLEVVEIVQVAAKCKKLIMMDLSEYNPAVESQRTGRFIVNLFYQFSYFFSQQR